MLFRSVADTSYYYPEDRGISESIGFGRKMAREAARGVLPNSTETKIVVTANVRAWRTMLELRTGEGAEQEIRRCAVAVLRVLQREAPSFFDDFEVYVASDKVESARVGFHKV